MTAFDNEILLLFQTFWDEDAGVWVATASDDLGIVTEAETLEVLRKRLAAILPDCLERAAPVPFELNVRQEA